MGMMPLRFTLFSSPKQIGLRENLASILGDVGRYLGERLDPDGVPIPDFELKSFHQEPGHGVKPWLDGPLHSVLVILVDDQLFEDDAFQGGELRSPLAWLREAASYIGANPESRHALLAVPLGVKARRRWQGDKSLSEFQTLGWEQLHVEDAPRLPMLAQRVLNLGIRTLRNGLPGGPTCRQRIFISHAKRDGFELAQTLRRYLSGIPWLDTFYDADDIEAGLRWKAQLQRGAESSIMLVLRTDAYDQRFWCRKEIRWAEEKGLARVVVDARTQLASPPSQLDFESAPYVRVPDGDLSRILFALLHTSLAATAFRRRVHELQKKELDPKHQLRLLPFEPSLRSFYLAGSDLKKGKQGSRKKRLIVHPDPPLADSMSEVVSAIEVGFEVKVCTPSEIQLEEHRG